MSLDASNNREDGLSPQRIATTEFASTRRGYDRDEVRAFLGKVAAQVAVLESMLSRVSSELEVHRRSLRGRPEDSILDPSMVGEQAAEVVRIASDTARAIRIQAESHSDAILERAERSSQRIVEDAEAKAEALQLESSQSAQDLILRAKKQADELVRHAETQSDELIEKARQEGSEIVARAKDLRTSYLDDARHKVDVLVKEVSELEAARNSVLSILTGAGRMIARAENTLDPESTRRVGQKGKVEVLIDSDSSDIPGDAVELGIGGSVATANDGSHEDSVFEDTRPGNVPDSLEPGGNQTLDSGQLDEVVDQEA
ncbi:MAG: DivIVA domain-containing protein [Acidimicrobiaceae bacterium]|nr:DivIVA domain-containing protein [Acidimicrobiaceae bacterium]